MFDSKETTLKKLKAELDRIYGLSNGKISLGPGNYEDEYAKAIENAAMKARKLLDKVICRELLDKVN
jgi:ribosomal protein S5